MVVQDWALDDEGVHAIVGVIGNPERHWRYEF